jgi:hypothetical protein
MILDGAGSFKLEKFPAADSFPVMAIINNGLDRTDAKKRQCADIGMRRSA